MSRARREKKKDKQFVTMVRVNNPPPIVVAALVNWSESRGIPVSEVEIDTTLAFRHMLATEAWARHMRRVAAASN